MQNVAKNPIQILQYQIKEEGQPTCTVHGKRDEVGIGWKILTGSTC